jgi:hypothetical protein
MTDLDRAKVIKGLEVCLATDMTKDENPCAPCPYFFDGMCQNTMKRDALALLREQEPHVMTMSEVKRIGADNHGSFKNDGLTVMWLEEFGKQYPLHVVVLKWDEDDWSGGPKDIVDVYYFGTDEYDRFGLTDYNLTWRCWTDKPTETQRMGAAWDA